MNLPFSKLIGLAIMFIWRVPILAQSDLKPGDIHPNAKYLDVDDFGNFYEGFCVVRNGNKTALIDSLGNLAFGFNNKFMPSCDGSAGTSAAYIREDKSGFFEGLCAVNDVNTGLVGFMNRKFELVIPCIHNDVTPFRHGFSKVTGYRNSTFFQGFINKKGERVEIKTNEYLELPLIPTTTLIKSKNLYGFTDLFGKIVIPPIYDYAREFSNGLAAVMKIDEFGKPKWGFIDSKGKLVIDFKFSIEPGDFYKGLAIVRPSDKQEFEYAYIDKAGEIRIIIDKKKFPYANSGIDSWTNSSFKPAFNHIYQTKKENNAELFKKGAFIEGLAMIINPYYSYGNGNNVILVDTVGNSQLYPILNGPFYSRVTRETYDGKSNKGGDGNLRIELPFINGIAKLWIKGQLYGIIDKKNEVLLPPVFNELILPNEPHEPIRAKYKVYKTGETEERDGFIDIKGLFFILKAKKPKW